MTDKTFFLGTHEQAWLNNTTMPLFLSARRLRRKCPRHRAAHPWALDSGGFSELSLFGAWRTTPQEYVAEVARWSAHPGLLLWAAPQDWMCEPAMLAKTGLTVKAHQDLTVNNYLALRDLWGREHGGRRSCPFIPVLQGQAPEDYLAHVESYRQAGVHLRAFPLVGVGTLCRRQASAEVARIVRLLHTRGLALHAFGAKGLGLALYGRYLRSADSLAWSATARRQPPLPGCSHRSCANCRRYALRWRAATLAAAGPEWS